MSVVVYAVLPRLIMPPTIVLTIVVPFLVALSVATVMDYLTIVHYTALRARECAGTIESFK
jgi:hypothetical protein